MLWGVAGLEIRAVRFKDSGNAVSGQVSGFPRRYGEWALVAGASEGLGEAFAEELAARGMNLMLLARRETVLAEVGGRLAARYGVAARWRAIDLSDPDFVSRVERACEDIAPCVLVYNAAYIPTGPFVDLSQEQLETLARVNVLGPMALLKSLLAPMRARGRGAVVLMSSMSGIQGWPRLAAYAASKSFNTILGEALWYELWEEGIDVVASCPGAVSTPAYFRNFGRRTPGMLTPEEVARTTLDALGKGPRVVPGRVNRIGWQIITRLLPRKFLIRLAGAAMKKVL